jgi:hypothetical protein
VPKFKSQDFLIHERNLENHPMNEVFQGYTCPEGRVACHPVELKIMLSRQATDELDPSDEQQAVNQRTRAQITPC